MVYTLNMDNNEMLDTMKYHSLVTNEDYAKNSYVIEAALFKLLNMHVNKIDVKTFPKINASAINVGSGLLNLYNSTKGNYWGPMRLLGVVNQLDNVLKSFESIKKLIYKIDNFEFKEPSKAEIRDFFEIRKILQHGQNIWKSEKGYTFPSRIEPVFKPYRICYDEHSIEIEGDKYEMKTVPKNTGDIYKMVWTITEYIFSEVKEMLKVHNLPLPVINFNKT